MQKTHKKISLLQISRFIIQMIFFVLIPGLYINAFSGIKQIYLGILHQNFNFVDFFPQMIEVITVIPVTIFLGRFFCGWMCAFGTLGDAIYLISSKVFRVSFRMNEQVDKKLKYAKFVLLGFLVVVLWSFDISGFVSFNPWNAFGVLATVGKTPDISYAFKEFTVGSFILLAIIAGSAFIERFFCRYLCPLGAIFSVISRRRAIKIKKPAEQCGSCKICTKNCAMGIPLYQYNHIGSGECISCLQCVVACPRNNAVVSMAGEDMRSGAAAALALVVMSGTYDGGSYLAKGVIPGNSIQSTSLDTSKKVNKIYQDGTYEGTGTGFRGATRVSVTVENDTITNIQLISHGDDAPYFDYAYPALVNQILSTQSTEVDAVSGATYSSMGIMEAVSNALESAKLSGKTAVLEQNTLNSSTEETFSEERTGEDTANLSSPTDSIPASAHESVPPKQTQTQSTKQPAVKPTNTAPKKLPTPLPVQTANSPTVTSKVNPQATPKPLKDIPAYKYKDGTYEGSARGYRGITTVSVTIKEHKIADIEVISHGDDAPFFDHASPTVICEIFDAQSTDVDTVSGATYSSLGIMNAVAEALSQAEVS